MTAIDRERDPMKTTMTYQPPFQGRGGQYAVPALVRPSCLSIEKCFARALQILRGALPSSSVDFRTDQWEAILGVLEGRRQLVVERTGWGKSAVYFIATKLLREQGRGPTIVVSPLLSLMRDQIASAEKFGLHAVTINSDGRNQKDITAEQKAKMDILFVSPERLRNKDFQRDFLFAVPWGLLVVDEAHCVSVWGQDFRPDYRRIVVTIRNLPGNIPVLATTATANDVIVDDIKAQLGEPLTIRRGPLARSSLILQNIVMPDSARRLAWLAWMIPQFKAQGLHSGIVYVLTQKTAMQVASWLSKQGIRAEAYHAGLEKARPGIRQELEQKLRNNEVDVLVATVALGMGFDKPDLGFVVHFQRPQSVVDYYQQVGRAGRACPKAYGVLLGGGAEDARIAEAFRKSAFPARSDMQTVFDAISAAPDGLTATGLSRAVDLPPGLVKKILGLLSVEVPAPIDYDANSRVWRRTPVPCSFDEMYARFNKVLDVRRRASDQMDEYLHSTGCLMDFLQKVLDDPSGHPCGHCANCRPELRLPVDVPDGLAAEARAFISAYPWPIGPRMRWPGTDMLPKSGLVIGAKVAIPPAEQMGCGWALARWGDGGWGELVQQGKYGIGRFDDRLVAAAARLVADATRYPVRPGWVACTPSAHRRELVPDFARRLAVALGIPFVPCVQCVAGVDRKEQKKCQNSYHQCANLDGAFQIVGPLGKGPCLLVDDMVDSRWTFTVLAALLRKAGCDKVMPFALADTSHNDED